MADKVRLIDANSVCKKIVESIRCAEEWANEAKEQQDTHGLRCATEAKTSLLAMLARIHDEPIIEAEPVKHGRWIRKDNSFPQRYFCTECGGGDVGSFAFCHHCGVRMDGDSK